jgi:hypothetical protein
MTFLNVTCVDDEFAPPEFWAARSGTRDMLGTYTGHFVNRRIRKTLSSSQKEAIFEF